MTQLSPIFALALLWLLALTPGQAEASPTLVRLETSAGDVVVQLDDARAPLTVANFLQYVRDGFYTGTAFHRVVQGFVVQGGGFTPELALKPARPPIPNESGNGLSNRRGTIAMARSADPHTADAQFYFNLADNLVLDPKPTRWGYAVFGTVIQGQDVIDGIGQRPTGIRDGTADVPLEPVVIRKVTIMDAPAPR